MIYSSKFRPAWWLRNPHAQTLWAAKMLRPPSPHITVERLTTPDDDFLDLAWTKNTKGPIVIIFHGLNGSVKSQYARFLMHRLQQKGLRTVLMHFRGCSGEPNKQRQSYHSGHTRDIAFVINTIKQRHPNTPIAAAGFSLGGNALLKYLGTTPDNPLQFAVSVCPPLVLNEGARRINQGFSRIYQHVLVKQCKEAVLNKHRKYPALGMDQYELANISNFFEFDHQVTAPIHGYDSGAHYYESASTLKDLINIKTATHILWARDDPFFSEKCIPAVDQLSAAVDFELSTRGGHVAFVSGNIPLLGKSWLCERVSNLLLAQLG